MQTICANQLTTAIRTCEAISHTPRDHPLTPQAIRNSRAAHRAAGSALLAKWAMPQPLQSLNVIVVNGEVAGALLAAAVPLAEGMRCCLVFQATSIDDLLRAWHEVL